MVCSLYLAFMAVRGIGGLSEIPVKLTSIYGAEKAGHITSMFPDFGSPLFWAVMVFIGLQWWTASNTDCGGYLAQRMLSAKDERHSFLGTLWFAVAHYCLRPWPWILVGLCAAILFPYLPDAKGVYPDPELGYVKIMLQFLGPGMLGLMLVMFFSAYMSTIDTHLNWGASYIVNDIYKRFIARGKSDRHYVYISIAATVFMAGCAAAVTMMLNSIVTAWYILTAIYSGLGVIYILRWFWWRINAWSELAAMIGAMLGTYVFRYLLGTKMYPGFTAHGIPWFGFPYVLLFIVPLALLAALVATYATPPVSDEQLIKFYTRVRPGGAGWLRIRKMIPGAENDPSPARDIPIYLAAVAAVYTALFGVGKIVLGKPVCGVILLAVSVILGAVIWKYVSRQNWQADASSEQH